MEHSFGKRDEEEMLLHVEKRKWIFLTFLILGIMVRVFMLGNIPGNRAVNMDEAYAGYEAFSLLHYGIDSHGYSMPVYLEAWGSGMNALETYCMIPFIKIFGLNSFSIRCPQAIFGIISLIAFYFLLKKITNQRTAIIGMALLAIMPWHIMMSRWGLESNLLPAFILFGTFFMLKAIENSKWMMLSMTCYGLALYCYATIWPLMPLLIGGSILYLMICKKVRFDRYMLASIGILILFAIPLFLFILVNLGYIDIIHLKFFSVPKLTVFRSGDISFDRKIICSRLHSSMSMMWTQDDGLPWNSISEYGMYYLFSNIFIFIGMGVSIFHIRSAFSKYMYEILIWIQLLVSVILAGLIETNVNRINLIHISLIFFCALGVEYTISRFGSVGKYAIFILYAVSFLSFLTYYVSDYDIEMAGINKDGIGESLQYAQNQNATQIHICGIEYPLILFYSEYPTDQFVNSVEYADPNARILYPLQFNGYTFTDFEQTTSKPGDTYICLQDDEGAMNYMREHGMDMHVFEKCVVGIAR